MLLNRLDKIVLLIRLRLRFEHGQGPLSVAYDEEFSSLDVEAQS